MRQNEEQKTSDRYLRKFGHPAPSPMRFAIDRSALPGLKPGMAGKGKQRKILDSDKNSLNHNLWVYVQNKQCDPAFINSTCTPWVSVIFAANPWFLFPRRSQVKASFSADCVVCGKFHMSPFRIKVISSQSMWAANCADPGLWSTQNQNNQWLNGILFLRVSGSSMIPKGSEI